MRKLVIESTSQILGRTYAKIKGRNGQPPFLSTGLTALDRIIWTIPKDKITLIASRPSHGKSSLCNQLSCHWSESGRNVSNISLEDDKEDFMEKIICNRFEVDNFELKRGIITGCDWAVVNEYVNNMRVLLFHDFGYNFSEFRYAVLGSPEDPIEPRPDVVILDYVQLLEGDNMLSKLNDFMREVKRFSKEEHLAIIVVCQINREGEKDGRPSLRHLKGAGILEEVSDLVLLLHHFWADKKFPKELSTLGLKDASELLEINVAKNKTGPRGRCYVRYKGKHYRFYNWYYDDTKYNERDKLSMYLEGRMALRETSTD